MAFALDGSDFDVPVINLLSDAAHPCQAIADVLTLRELLGPLPGEVLAYIGDANNMCRSLVKAALMEGMDVRVASPPGYSFSAEELDRLTAFAARVGRGGKLLATQDPEVAAGGADALYTDVWTSMGQEDEKADRLAGLQGLHHRRRPARPGRAGRLRPALPAGPPGRGDLRLRLRGPAQRGLEAGGAPADGHAGDPGLGRRGRGGRTGTRRDGPS